MESRGTFAEDHAYRERRMQHMLGTLEIGHLKPTPIFPQSVLGHLYMRKFGLSREQRAQIIRATNGSSRLRDVERIMRASDLEEHRVHDKRHVKQPKRDAYMVHSKHSQHVMLADDGDESSELVDYENEMSETSDEVFAAEGNDDDSDDEAQEVLELHKKSKDKFRKAFKSYKESGRKVKEIKKSRQSYYPVVALTQPIGDGSATGSTSQGPVQKQPFRYDRKPGNSKGVGKKKPESVRSKREEANITESQLVTRFNYMVNVDTDNRTGVWS